ncbi:MAG: AarF/UbiB family protein, partial [Gammaproteobacteria bacterium]|nr:AarF/UbiB family protein [Gammaproteobacteria bacterium]
IKALHKAGVDMEVLANRGVEIFFTQVFKHSYFHADMHPGNIFVDVTDPMQPKYIGIDCGIMGMLSEVDKRYLAQNFDAFFNRDYKRIAQLHLDSGWVPAHVSVEQFESAIRAACEPIFGKPLDEISFGHFLVQLFHTARQFDMEVQTQLVLLQKTLLYVEGLGRQLYPKLDLWKTAKPFLRDWLSETYGIKAVLNKLKDKAPEWLEQIPEIPDKVNQVVHHLKTQSENQKVLAENMEKLSDSQKSLKKSLRWSLLGVGLILLSFVSLPEVISWPYIKETLLGLSAVSFVLSFRQ